MVVGRCWSQARPSRLVISANCYRSLVQNVRKTPWTRSRHQNPVYIKPLKGSLEGFLAIRHLFCLPLGFNPQFHAVGNELHVAVAVGPVDVFTADLPHQAADHFVVGMSERVVAAHGYQRHRRVHRIDEPGGR